MGNKSSSGSFCILNEACCVMGRKGTEMSTQVDEQSLSNPHFIEIEKDEATIEME